MIFRLVSAIFRAGTLVLNGILRGLLVCIAAFAVSYKLGWFDRFIWYSAEKEGAKVLNGTPVTIGAIQVDWSRLAEARVTVNCSNVIIHTPQRELWQWESPLLARIGNITVDCNIPITLFNFLVFRRHVPLELYSVQVSDVQVFVERRQNVLNLYLMDPSLVLPDPTSLANSEKENASLSNGGDSSLAQSTSDDQSTPKHSFSDEERQRSTDEAVESSSSSIQAKDQGNDPAHERSSNQLTTSTSDVEQEKAQQLVSDMLQAVKSIGRAAQEGSIQTELHQQGYHWADKLRAGFTGQNRHETAKVIKHVHKAAVQSFQQASQMEQLLVPERRRGSAKPVKGRVSRIVLEEMRIFTRDSWISTSSTSNSDPDSSRNVSTAASSAPATSSGSGWNKPIYLESVVVRASELCPPLSSNDDDGLPAVYQTLDKVGEVVSRRLLAEMAKSNTGRLFSTAFSEVVSYLNTKPKSTAA